MILYTAFGHDKAMDKGAPRRVYGTLGDGELQKRVAASLVEWILPADARDFNFETLDGEVNSLAQVLSSAYSLPFLSDFRVVHVKRAERLDGLNRAGEGDEKKAKSGKVSPSKALADAIKNLPASTVLIFSRTSETPEPGARAGVPRCLHATVDKAIEDKAVGGLIVDCTVGAKNPGLATSVLEAEAKKKNIKFERGVAAYLVERAGTDITKLEAEMEKCALRGGSAPISRAVVDEMVKRAPQESIFDLTDALGERKSARAIALARELLENGEPAELLLSMLVRHFRQLLQARALLDARLSLDGNAAGSLSPAQASQFPQEARDNLPALLRSQGWLGRRLAAQARNFSIEQITQALSECLKADLALKGIEGDGGAESNKHPELVVELLLAKLA